MLWANEDALRRDWAHFESLDPKVGLLGRIVPLLLVIVLINQWPFSWRRTLTKNISRSLRFCVVNSCYTKYSTVQCKFGSAFWFGLQKSMTVPIMDVTNLEVWLIVLRFSTFWLKKWTSPVYPSLQITYFRVRKAFWSEQLAGNRAANCQVSNKKLRNRFI